MPSSKPPSAVLRAIALRHPNVEESVACKGTVIEQAAFKIQTRTFLFSRDVQMMVKLGDSIPEAQKHADADPQHFRVGGPWVTVNFTGNAMPPREMLERWIAESYALMSAPKKAAPKKAAAKKAQAKKAPAKKVAVKKTITGARASKSK
jgi:hypothetical protein